MGDEPTIPYPVGTKVRKVGGTYQADVTVIAVGVTSTGAVRYLCEFDDLPGMLHVFNGGQLEVKEKQTVATEKTQGEYTWESVQVGDRVRLTQATDSHGDIVIESVVLMIDEFVSSVRLAIDRDAGRWFDRRDNKSIELVSRPPRRVEISKEDLILKTPIGTKVVLEFPDEPGQKAGKVTQVFRDYVDWAVSIDRATVYYFENIKAIYTEV